MPSVLDYPAFPENCPVIPLYVIDYKLLLISEEEQLRFFNACKEMGFFYLKNHDIETKFMFELATALFNLDLQEKLKYNMGTEGQYCGYKRKGATYVDAKGTPDKIEFYNIAKDDALNNSKKPGMAQPEFLQAKMNHVREFIEGCHAILIVLLELISQKLGLEKETLSKMHQIHDQSGDHARFTRSVSQPVDDVTSGLLGEHTDFGSMTILFNRLGGLQILEPGTDEWKYVKPIPEHAIINLGDAMVKFTNGLLRSNMHRVVDPPGDQRYFTRHSLVYFTRPAHGILLKPLKGGIIPPITDAFERYYTSEEWVARRVKNLNVVNFKGIETFLDSRGTEHTKVI